jgi:hypothetical protein
MYGRAEKRQRRGCRLSRDGGLSVNGGAPAAAAKRLGGEGRSWAFDAVGESYSGFVTSG